MHVIEAPAAPLYRQYGTVQYKFTPLARANASVFFFSQQLFFFSFYVFFSSLVFFILLLDLESVSSSVRCSFVTR